MEIIFHLTVIFHFLGYIVYIQLLSRLSYNVEENIRPTINEIIYQATQYVLTLIYVRKQDWV